MIPGYKFSKKANPMVGYGSPIAGEFAATQKLSKSAQAPRQQDPLYEQQELEKQISSGGLKNKSEKYGLPLRAVSMSNTPYGNLNYYNRINGEDLSYEPVSNNSNIHGVVEMGGDPLENMNKLVNTTNNQKVRANLEMQYREKQKARAKAFGVPYEPGKRYLFSYDIPGLDIPTYKLPSIFDTGKPATYFIVPGVRAYADKTLNGAWKRIGALPPNSSLRTLVHEGVTGIGHAGTAGTLNAGTQSIQGKIFTSAKHGDEGRSEFLYDRPGSEPPSSYFNSIVEQTGLLNRMKIVSGASDTPFTFIEFNRGDPDYKIKPNEAGGYNVMDWLERQGIVSWNPKTMQYDYTDKRIPSTIPLQESLKIYIDSYSKKYDKRREAWNNLYDLYDAKDAIRALAPANEINAFIQQVNRIYYLQEKARKGTITKDESKELDRATKILKHNVSLSHNRRTPSIPGYTYNPTVIG